MADITFRKWLIIIISLVAVSAAGVLLMSHGRDMDNTDTIVSGNGRIEATEIDIATKFHGRIDEILYSERDFLEAGQVVARMDTKSLEAQLRQVEASVEQAHHVKSYAQALEKQRKSELRKDKELAVTSLRDLNLCKKYNVTALLLKKKR
jgi:HlyD family secretion protein